MDFFNKIGDIANKTYQKTSKKTNEIAKEAKLKIKMNEEKSKINDLYKEIGKNVYQKHIDESDGNCEERIESCCSQIDELSKKVADFQTELLSIKNKRICENCYEEIDLNVKYCPHCGYEQEEIKFQDKENENVEDKESIEDDKIEIEQEEEETTDESEENNDKGE